MACEPGIFFLARAFSQPEYCTSSLSFPTLFPLSPFSNLSSHAHPDLTMPKRKPMTDSERQALADRPKPKSSMSSIPDAEDFDAVKAVVQPVPVSIVVCCVLLG